MTVPEKEESAVFRILEAKKAAKFIQIGLAFCFFFFLQSCNLDAQQASETTLIVGAEQPAAYLPYLQNQRVALVVNQTSTVKNGHLVDALLGQKVNIVKVFAPEHGFRGEASAGQKISDQTDKQTGLPIISLYGKNKKPSAEQLADVDVLVFDIQDVGARFYTYISTLFYVMEAAAEQQKQVIVLDRPNPNGHYVDGPVLEKGFESFVGIIPVPVVHGCTVGELAKMMNGEKWLASGVQADLRVIPVKNYQHRLPYDLPVKPSPNLPNQQAILLYPSICFFEGTVVSVGRGTETQFQVIGSPYSGYGNYTFTPKDMPGAENPPNEGKACYGFDLRSVDARKQQFTLKYVIDFYANYRPQNSFFINERFFNLLMGNDWVLQAIKAGKTETEIRARWQPALDNYLTLRKNYLLYP